MSRTQVISALQTLFHLGEDECAKIYAKAQAGGEFQNETQASQWLEERLKPNLVWIDESGYAQMCLDALKVMGKTAATDYGTSRQRDFGQHWADTIRGYLAEYALLLYLQQTWGIQATLGHELGSLSDYLTNDIRTVKTPADSQPRPPKLKISIKGTKWNGIWLDLPNQQFFHSDIHVLAKVGVGTDHLFAYFKHISVFRDKLLPLGVQAGYLGTQEAEALFERLPTFQAIPAYIVGFVDSQDSYPALPYTGKKGKKHFMIQTWGGPLQPGDLEKIAAIEGIKGQVKFEGIGEFSHSNAYLFNCGQLRWQAQDWQKHVIERL